MSKQTLKAIKGCTIKQLMDWVLRIEGDFPLSDRQKRMAAAIRAELATR